MVIGIILKMLVLGTLVQGIVGDSGEETWSPPPCVDDAQPISTTYWTDWYSSNGSLTDAGEQENFTQICSPIVETECREKYTRRSLADTGLSFTTPCVNGVLLCQNLVFLGAAPTGAAQNCSDMEMRLKCTTTDGMLRKPDFEWSLSELDTGNTRGAVESWQCDNDVQEVAPIIGDLYGIADGPNGLNMRASYATELNRCAVKTNGLLSLSFMPFVRSCLTDQDCSSPPKGITVSFWFHKDEQIKNESNVQVPRPQEIPLHVFRSPYLLITMQEGYLIVTYRTGSTTSSVRGKMAESSWRFVTVTYDPDPADPVVKIYRNDNDVAETASDFDLGAWPILAEFEAVNTSFQVFSSKDSADNVKSSDIRPIAITKLRIFYEALSNDDVEQLFLREESTDLPAKVVRMSTIQMQFLDYLTQEKISHIRLKCLIRVHSDAPFVVRYMYTNDPQNGSYHEMTSDVFKMRTYLDYNNIYRKYAVVQVLGRHDGSALPLYYTCDPVSPSHVSGYGYEIIGIQKSTEINESVYYWTKFFDSGPPDNDGEEDESKDTHKRQARDEGYEWLCNNPIYAECRAKNTNSSITSVKWYDATPMFVPQYDYMCEDKGIRCSPQDDEGNNQTCPDLIVRYACLGQGPTASPEQPPDNNQPNEQQPSTVTVFVCEGDLHVLDCGGGLINISNALYGRTQSNVCVTSSTTDCERDVTDELVNLCEGQMQCTVEASNGIAGDPCSGVHKYLEITYSCGASTVQLTGTTNPPNNIQQTDNQHPSTDAVQPTTQQGNSNQQPTQQHPLTEPTGSTQQATNNQQPDNDSSTDTNMTSGPVTPPSPDGQPMETGRNSKDSFENFKKAVKNNLNWIYPVLIVALGVGIPTIISLYFLFRKKTPAELEAQRLLIEKRREEANRPPNLN